MEILSLMPFRFSGVIILGAAFLFLVPALLMWLWNLTMPQVFRLPAIQYWQAFRLLIIATILFGGTIRG